VVTLQETVWADYFGRLTIATVRSIGRPFTIVSSAGGPVLAAVAYDVTGSYTGAFVVFIVAYVLAAVMILFTPTPRRLVPATSLPQVRSSVLGSGFMPLSGASPSKPMDWLPPRRALNGYSAIVGDEPTSRARDRTPHDYMKAQLVEPPATRRDYMNGLGEAAINGELESEREVPRAT
jgi:hypothetical protein